MSVSKSDLAGFADCLKNGDRSPGTIEKYLGEFTLRSGWDNGN